MHGQQNNNKKKKIFVSKYRCRIPNLHFTQTRNFSLPYCSFSTPAKLTYNMSELRSCIWEVPFFRISVNAPNTLSFCVFFSPS